MAHPMIILANRPRTELNLRHLLADPKKCRGRVINKKAESLFFHASPPCDSGGRLPEAPYYPSTAWTNLTNSPALIGLDRKKRKPISRAE